MIIFAAIGAFLVLIVKLIIKGIFLLIVRGLLRGIFKLLIAIVTLRFLRRG